MEIIVIIVIVVFLLWRILPAKGIKSMTAEQLKNILNDRDKQFIDVRTRGEFKARNIRQFKNMPLGSDYSKLNKEQEVIVICQSGMRSMKACKQLKKLGFTRVINIKGGMSAY